MAQRYRPALATLEDVASEVAKVYRMMRNGEIPVQDGSKFTYVLRELFSMREKIVTATAIEELQQKVNALMEGQHVGTGSEIEEIAASLRGD